MIAGLVITAFLLALGAGFVASKRTRHPGERRAPYRYPASLRVGAMTVLGLFVVAAIIAIFGVLQYDVVDAAAPTGDQFGVAVAEFGSEKVVAPSADGRDLSTFVARTLRREIDARRDLSGRVTVVTAPVISSDREARDYAAKNRVQLVIWGKMAETEKDGFVPSVTLVDSTGYQVWYGDVPAWRDVSPTGFGSVTLSRTTARAAEAFTRYLMGLVDLNRGNYSQAALYLQQAINRSSIDAQASQSAGQEQAATLSLADFHLALARADAALGDAGKARLEYQSSLLQDPGSAAAYVGLGNIDYSQGACANALDAYGRAVQTGPSLPATWYSHGNAYFCLHRYADAASDYRQAVQLSQAAGEPAEIYHLVLGAALCRVGDTKEGIAQLAQAGQGGALHMAATETESCTSAENMARATLEHGGGSGQSTPAAAANGAAPTATALNLTPTPDSAAAAAVLSLFDRLRSAFTGAPTSAPSAAIVRAPTDTPAAPTYAPQAASPAPRRVVSPSNTPAPPVYSPLPTVTSTGVPPSTWTPAPSQTASPLPPSATATAQPPPSATAVPPTAALPPTAEPPTAAPPTAAPPTTAPPVSATSTAVPVPTAAPPTATAVPPSPAPPTPVPATASAPTAAPTQPAQPTVAPQPTAAPQPTMASQPTVAPQPTSTPHGHGKPPKHTPKP